MRRMSCQIRNARPASVWLGQRNERLSPLAPSLSADTRASGSGAGSSRWASARKGRRGGLPLDPASDEPDLAAGVLVVGGHEAPQSLVNAHLQVLLESHCHSPF